MSVHEFTLKDQFDKEVSLAGFKGKKILLSYHPMAWTSICGIQMQDLEKRYDQFLAKGVTPFGMSIDHQYCKEAWGKSLDVKRLQMLCDFWPHGALAQKLGCFIEKAGVSGRQNYLIGPDGEVLFTKRYEIHEQPDFDAFLKEMPA